MSPDPDILQENLPFPLPCPTVFPYMNIPVLLKIVQAMGQADFCSLSRRYSHTFPWNQFPWDIFFKPILITARGLWAVPGSHCTLYLILDFSPPIYSYSQITMKRKIKLADICLQISFFLSFQLPRHFRWMPPGSKCETWNTQIALNDGKPGRGSQS